MVVPWRRWNASSTWACGLLISWSCHIESVCCRAKQQLGFLSFSPHCDAGIILTLYKAHVLLILDMHALSGTLIWGRINSCSNQFSILLWKLPVDHGTWTTKFFIPVMIWLPLQTGDHTLNSLLLLSLFMAVCIALAVIFFINNLPT